MGKENDYRLALEKIANAQRRLEPEADVLIAWACEALGLSVDWLDGLALKIWEERARRASPDNG